MLYNAVLLASDKNDIFLTSLAVLNHVMTGGEGAQLMIGHIPKAQHPHSDVFIENGEIKNHSKY